MKCNKRLQAAREAAGLRQTDLARKCNYAVATVGNVEKGRARVSLDFAVVVAKELRVSAAWLLGLDEPEISYETALAVIVAQGRQEEAVQALGRME